MHPCDEWMDDRFGQLHSELYRACEVVIDTGIHAYRLISLFIVSATSARPAPSSSIL